MTGIAAAGLMPPIVAGAGSIRRGGLGALQNSLDEFVAERSGAGLGVGICYGDGPPAYPSAGTLAFDSMARFDENSICRLYSITRNVTRIATLLLVEDGKLSLDQPVADHAASDHQHLGLGSWTSSSDRRRSKA